MNITLPLIFGLALGVSALSAQVPPNARTGDSDARLTVIGCIQRSAPSPAATTGTTAIPARATKYVLSNITLSADPSPASPAESAARAMDIDAIPGLGVADVVDRDVVVLAPEEGHRVESLAASQHVAGRRLALPFGDHPVLHANAVAGVRIGPSRDIAGGEDARHAGFEVLVDGDPPVDREPGALGEAQRRTNADAEHEEVDVHR